ncbi:unnamed protein product [Onchocerca flexuosa]|uniref:Inorganic phosphate transporter n=1 Tax=Onchocerca flexuosa TaxID=387005 RepID=A0A183I4X7_9BILA|nr:unnamed protein product [Onchocerca flexuosa]
MMTTSLIPFSSTISATLVAAFRNDVLWALILGIILAFILGFAMGANDVANAFGTSVGSKVLTLRQAYMLAVIFETLGALLVGCSLWLLVATFARLPVSSTHSITGATVGFGLLTRVASWFLSPVLSGVVSALLYIIVDHSVLRRILFHILFQKNPFRCGWRVLPIFYWLCIAFNVFTVSYHGSKLLHLSKLPLWLCALVSVGCATAGSIIIHFFLSPKLKAWINSKFHSILSFRSIIFILGSFL